MHYSAYSIVMHIALRQIIYFEYIINIINLSYKSKNQITNINYYQYFGFDFSPENKFDQ